MDVDKEDEKKSNKTLGLYSCYFSSHLPCQHPLRPKKRRDAQV
jgi:hypothetical protein